MNDIIQTALASVNNVSVESSAGLERALDDIGALSPTLTPEQQRTALIEVVAPALKRHPVDTQSTIVALHAPIEEYQKHFSTKVAPTICNLFLFQ